MTMTQKTKVRAANLKRAAALKKPIAKPTAAKKAFAKVSPAKVSPAKASPAKKPLRTSRVPRAARLVTMQTLFATLGARDPAQWAAAQLDSGVDEVTRFVLLRALWMKAVEPGRLLAKAQATAHVKDALARMLGTVSLTDVDALVRLAEEQVLHDVLGVLDDASGGADGAVGWGVFRTDARGAPVRRIAPLLARLHDAKP